VGASTGKGTAGVLGFSGDSIGVEGFTFTGTALYGHSGDGNAASMKNDSSSHATTALRNAGSGDVLIMQANGGSFIRAVNNAGDKTLFSVSSDGTTITNVLQINGGADLSEKFEVKAPLDIDSNVLSQEVHPGMIVVIDPDNSGKLVVSSQSYDRKVAGIISGAGGIKPGMLMSQSSSVADGSHPVALTGRVYCWADASNSPIYPGDLLTTSKIPGHAMKVCNYEKAQGAIIGKAMTGLKSGRGLVLVLVTLQ